MARVARLLALLSLTTYGLRSPSPKHPRHNKRHAHVCAASRGAVDVGGAVAALAAAAALTLGGPAVAENELAALGAKGFDSSLVDTSCFAEGGACGAAAKACLNTGDCRRGMTCTAKCLGDNACITGCFAKYGNAPMNDLLECSIEKNSCIKVAILPPGPDSATEAPAPPLVPVANFDQKTLEGTWYKVMGWNDRYDCRLPEELVRASGATSSPSTSSSPCRGRPRGPTPAPERSSSSTRGAPGAPRRRRRRPRRQRQTEGHMFGLTFWENWSVIGENARDEPEFKFIHYSGRTSQNTYEGARGEPLPAAKKSVYRIAKEAGMVPANFCAVRNDLATCGVDAPAAATPRLCALALVFAPKPSRPQAPQPPPNGRTYGVAWTRNNARPGDVEQLRELYVSAASLRRRGRSTPTTLFTELARDDVDAAMRYFADDYGHARPPTSLFDAVLNVSDAAAATRDIPRPLREAAAASLANASAERRDLATSRLGRLHHFARAPYDVTLFLDDDTALCADAAGEATLALALRDVDAPPSDAPPVRLASNDGSQGKHQSAARFACAAAATLACARDACAPGACGDYASAACRACRRRWCAGEDLGACGKGWDRLQGGAVAVVRGWRAASFVADWIQAYVDAWLAGHDARVFNYWGMDQVALTVLLHRDKKARAEESRLGALPAEFNVRFAWTPLGNAFDDRMGVLVDRALVLHQHALARDAGNAGLADPLAYVDRVCGALNAVAGRGPSRWWSRRQFFEDRTRPCGRPTTPRGARTAGTTPRGCGRSSTTPKRRAAGRRTPTTPGTSRGSARRPAARHARAAASGRPCATVMYARSRG
ncbi:VDE lipocalin domain-containing protein [Aureococcus anophagefferens]|nr:VDE lipocalin domain-containing protein [Aureococcus anophagefferens]